MKTNERRVQFTPNGSRRAFLREGSFLVASAGLAGLSGMALSCTNRESTESARDEDEEEEQVAANEDLMREHGLLQRMQLIYDNAIATISTGKDFSPEYVRQTAEIIRDFIEDYHEKLEEEHIFPRLEQAHTLTDLTSTLRTQHRAGRLVTGQIIATTKNDRSLDQEEGMHLVRLMRSFNAMYRPHESREDTILFPAFKEVVSPDEYASLGEDFEKIEHQKFGEGGFESMVDRVAEIEKQVGIYDLAQFTPHPEEL